MTQEQSIEFAMMLRQHFKSQDSEIDCPACGGDGFTVEVYPACCGNYNEHNHCCDNPIPEQHQVGCELCNTTGKIKSYNS